LAQIGAIAGLHHERLDGSGYHRGVAAGAQPFLARILAAACVYQTELSEQPRRPVRSPEEAGRLLQAEASAGGLDQQAVSAVLAAAGLAVKTPRLTYPAGLSEREVDVLQLMARGLSRKEIAGRLVIADKTVARHIEHIYDKIGVSTRPGATLFAMTNGLLQP
jgi:DNA-binding NarL/FixJ family response regulator